jgi:hypothetical protein
MTATTWRPFIDDPLFTGELLLGPDALPDDLHNSIIEYLTEVAAVRSAPLHPCTAFNALHFGFDVPTRSYRAAVLDPDLFLAVTASPIPRTVLPVGTFVRIDRGRHSLWAEVVARYGADPDVDADGWVPAELSGAPDHVFDGRGHGVWERTILDFEAFGSPLSAVERTELHRARQRGNLLDAHGHLIGPVTYPPLPVRDIRDDMAWYSTHLLGPARAMLIGGPLGGLLTDPDDDTVLAEALQQALATVDALLDRVTGLRRFAGYATPRQRFDARRRTGWPGLPASDVDETTHMLSRASASPRYTAIWPLLATCSAQHDTGYDPLELAGAADVIVHANLVAADRACEQVPTGDDLRIDDVWQSGGVWRSRLQKRQFGLVFRDPLRPLGLGHLGDPEDLRDGDDSAPDQTTSGRDDTPAPAGGGNVQPAQRKTPDCQSAAGIAGDTNSAFHDLSHNDPETVEPEADHPPVVSEVIVVDSLVGCTVTLRESHLDGDLLPIADACAEVLATGPLLVELHHDGDPLDDNERVHIVVTEIAETPGHASGAGAYLRGVAWPLGFYPGIKVRVAVVRGARRISASTTLLEVPLPFGDEFRWDADPTVLAVALGLPVPEPGADAPGGGALRDPIEASDEGGAQVLDRHRGIDQLRTTIVSVLRRYGRPGAFGARRLNGPQLLAAMFGDDVIDSRLLWQVIYTCERLVELGPLTCEPNPADPDRPGSGGPDTFVWWPDDTARRQGQTHTTSTQRLGVLAGHVRERWVPPHCRLLPDGYRASDTARDEYAAWIRKIRGPNAPAGIPDGYTFVRGGPRGSVQDGSWIHLAATTLTTTQGTR